MSGGEERAFAAADGHGDVPVDRRRGLDPAVGGRRRRRWRSPSPATTSCSTRRSSATAACARWSRARATAWSARSAGRRTPSAAAVAAQRALAAEPWPAGAELRVRMAVHTGEAQLRDERQLRRPGAQPLLPGSARIGHGGQVLVSAATAALVADRLPDGATLVDLGVHRLKDLGRPEHVWQLVHPDLPSEFPPLRSLDAFRHNLPVQLTPLIGRQGEIADVGGLLAGERLVTLTGSAGCGQDPPGPRRRRRGARRAPRRRVVGRAGPAGRPGAVGRAALAAVGAREAPGVLGRPTSWRSRSATQPSLLVLDNCEHLIARCAELVAELLAANPAVVGAGHQPRAARRAGRDHLAGAVAALPDTRSELSTSRRCRSTTPSSLFVERARRARPSFARDRRQRAGGRPDLPPPRRHPAGHRAGRRPLPAAVGRADRRRARRPLPAPHRRRPHRDGPPADPRRRRSTGATTGSTTPSRSRSAASACSPDPFPLEAAEAVVAAPAATSTPPRCSTSSADSSTRASSSPTKAPAASSRYRLLETLRAYALDRARAAGELTIVRDAHAAWWADWLEPRGAMPTDDILDEIEEFHANLKAALDWSVDQTRLGLRLLRGRRQGLGAIWAEPATPWPPPTASSPTTTPSGTR